jgi:protein involved in sex pheromone biosynthesis
LAGRIVDRLRKKTDVPILVATYAIGQSGYLPGVFTQSALVKEKARTIDNWENIDESYLLLPASLGMGPTDEQLTAQQFTGLKDAVEKAFPNFVTITGMGRFMDQKLSEMTIDVSSQFQSKTEVMFVTQLVANQVKQYFNRKVYVSVYVKMINTPQAIYIKRADGTEFFHIYRD